MLNIVLCQAALAMLGPRQRRLTVIRTAAKLEAIEPWRIDIIAMFPSVELYRPWPISTAI